MTVETASALRSLRTQTLVGTVSLGHGATHWAVATFFLLLPAMSRDLGLSYTQAGLLATAYFVGSMISNLPSGIVVDLTGKRIRYQLLALLLGSASLAALGTTSSFAALWACLVLLGASNMLWHPAAISYLSLHLPRNRGYSMAIHSLGAHIGDAAGPLAAGWLLLSFSWQRNAQINAFMGVICAGLIILVCGRDDPRSAPRRQPGGAYWKGLLLLLKSRAQWSFFLMSGFRTMTQAGLLTFLPLFLAADRAGRHVQHHDHRRADDVHHQPPALCRLHLGAGVLPLCDAAGDPGLAGGPLAARAPSRDHQLAVPRPGDSVGARAAGRRLPRRSLRPDLGVLFPRGLGARRQHPVLPGAEDRARRLN